MNIYRDEEELKHEKYKLFQKSADIIPLWVLVIAVVLFLAGFIYPFTC